MATTNIENIMARKRVPFNIKDAPESLQKTWVRRALLAHNHNTGDALTFEEVWGIWDLDGCGPMAWGCAIERNNIRVFPFPKSWDERSDNDPPEPPSVEEILGRTCVKTGWHDIPIGDVEDIVRLTTDEALRVFKSAYDPCQFHWSAHITEDMVINALSS